MKKNNNDTVFVIAAHPDDEILGCGATIAEHSSRGDDVHILILGTGLLARNNPKDNAASLSKLNAHAKKAAKIVGARSISFCDFPDNQFDSVPLLKIIKEIEKIAKQIKPSIVYTHNHSDVNIDHRQTSLACQAAFRPLPKSSVKSVFAFEVPSSTEWNFINSNRFCPNTFFSLSEKSLSKKINALESYESEIKNFPHPRSSEYLKALAKIRGAQAGFFLAEAFEVVYLRK